MSTSLCIYLQTEKVIATCIMQHNTETQNTLQNVKWNIQTKDMTKMTLCNYSAILHVRRAQLMCHLEDMPGKCHGSYLLPHMVMVGLHMEVI